MKVETSISIARSPDEVFAYVADVRNDPTWHTDVLEVRSATDAVGVETVFGVKVKPSMAFPKGRRPSRASSPGSWSSSAAGWGRRTPR
jgi:polyketide cyclase/dehydrase/lipid transport protein